MTKVMQTAKDLTEKREVPTPTDTIARERLGELISDGIGGAYADSRVISPPMRMAVRQNHPDGPAYQEALSYTFLIHSMKFPRITRLGDGRIVLVATGWTHAEDAGGATAFIAYSDDEGQNWSQPREILRGSMRPQPVALGGQQLMLYRATPEHQGSRFSDDGGETWTDGEPMPKFEGKPTYHHGSLVVEGETIYSISFYEGAPHGPGAPDGPTDWVSYSVLWISHDLGRTWDSVIPLPEDWCACEGALTRARDGALVLALRVWPAEWIRDLPEPDSDHRQRIATARSMDNGLTWTDYQIHFDYGRMHTDLITLANGDIMMTYASRMGDIDGEMFHGVEAVLSHDNGQTWDWDNRFILFRWAMHESMAWPVSMELADGRILTLYTYHYHPSWGEGALGAPGYPMGITSAVIWSPR